MDPTDRATPGRGWGVPGATGMERTAGWKGPELRQRSRYPEQVLPCVLGEQVQHSVHCKMWVQLVKVSRFAFSTMPPAYVSDNECGLFHLDQQRKVVGDKDHAEGRGAP